MNEDVDGKPARVWSPVVIALMAANIIMFVVEIATGVDPITPKTPGLLALGGNFAPLTLHGEPWRLATCMFLHAGILHLGMNMLCLFQARIVEKLYGRVAFFSIYVVAGLCGSAASALRSPDVVSVGASGAVFGVFGAFGAFVWMRRAQLDPQALAKIVRGLGTFVVINLLYGMLTPGVDMTAHVGGIVGGFACGAVLLAGKRLEPPRIVRAIAVGVVGIAIVTVAIVAIPERSGGYMGTLREFDRVQASAINAYNELVHKHDDGTLTDAQFATAVETDVLPPWHALRVEFDKATGVPTKFQPTFTAMTRLVTLREEAWRALVAMLRDPGNAALATDAESRSQAAAAAVTELDVMMIRLDTD